MDENELDDIIKKLIRKTVSNIEFPPNVLPVEDDKNGVVFSMIFRSSFGDSIVVFSPSIENLKKLYTGPIGASALPEALSNHATVLYVEAFIEVFLKTFYKEIALGFSNMQETPGFLLDYMVISGLESRLSPIEKQERERTGKSDVDSKKVHATFFKERTNQIQKIISKTLEEAKVPKHQYRELFSHFYKTYLPRWNEAKDIYKRFKDKSKWREMILLVHEDLPKDLIDKLEHTSALRGELTKAPYELALEHAARMCGIPNNYYQRSQLLNIKKESEEWAKENGEEGENVLLRDMLENVLYSVLFAKRYDLLSVSESLHEWDSLPHQLMSEILNKEGVEDSALEQLMNPIQD